MDIPATLAADLTLLTAALADPDPPPTIAIADTVLALVIDARLAVPSLVGLTITATNVETSVRASDVVLLQFTLLDAAVDPSDIATSLRLPGPAERAASDRVAITLVLYACVPGAFVDLAADLCFLTGRELDAGDLDQHLTLAREPDITGVLHIRTSIHEAIGVLITRGRTHQQAFAELDTLADAAHTDRAVEASRILAALSQGHHSR